MREGLGSANSGLSGLSAVAGSGGASALDVIEANFHGAWLESYFTYNGPDVQDNLDEVKFFDC
jgi:hypothetical protein